jgi:hypothetical protein
MLVTGARDDEQRAERPSPGAWLNQQPLLEIEATSIMVTSFRKLLGWRNGLSTGRDGNQGGRRPTIVESTFRVRRPADAAAAP